MKPDELQKLNAEQKKAMEAINVFNNEAKELNKTINNILGK